MWSFRIHIISVTVIRDSCQAGQLGSSECTDVSKTIGSVFYSAHKPRCWDRKLYIYLYLSHWMLFCYHVTVLGVFTSNDAPAASNHCLERIKRLRLVATAGTGGFFKRREVFIPRFQCCHCSSLIFFFLLVIFHYLNWNDLEAFASLHCPQLLSVWTWFVFVLFPSCRMVWRRVRQRIRTALGNCRSIFASSLCSSASSACSTSAV